MQDNFLFSFFAIMNSYFRSNLIPEGLFNTLTSGLQNKGVFKIQN